VSLPFNQGINCWNEPGQNGVPIGRTTITHYLNPVSSVPGIPSVSPASPVARSAMPRDGPRKAIMCVVLKHESDGRLQVLTPHGKMTIDMSKVTTRIPEELDKTAVNNQRALFGMILDRNDGAAACVEVQFQSFLSEKGYEQFMRLYG